MNKEEFFRQLNCELNGIPLEEKQRTIDYYAELISDAAEDGVSEEEVIAGFDNPHTIAQNIVNEIPMTRLVKENMRGKKPTAALIILLIATSFIWIPILVGIITAAVSIYVGIWSVIISFFAAFLGIAASGIACIVAIFFTLANPARMLLFAGCAMILTGLSVFALFFSIWCAKITVKFTIFLIRKTKQLFINKGGAVQ